MSRLLLVRHGVSEFNSVRRLAGYSDVVLTPLGHEQAERLRERLAETKIDAVYSSDLGRALTTAEVISSPHQVRPVVCSELREINYGEVEGLTFDEISHLYPELAELITNFSLQLKFPGGENFEEFVERVSRFLERLKAHAPSETVLLVSHSGPLKVLMCHLLGIDQSHWRQIRCDNASLSIIDTYPRGAIISLLNDTSHLK